MFPKCTAPHRTAPHRVSIYYRSAPLGGYACLAAEWMGEVWFHDGDNDDDDDGNCRRLVTYRAPYGGRYVPMYLDRLR